MFHAGEKLILASKSPARARLLASVGVGFDVMDAEIDERAVEQRILAGLEANSQEAARRLASGLALEKARAIAALSPNRWVLGADQVLACEGAICHKARTPEEGCAQLRRLRGRTHYLFSGLALLKGEKQEMAHCSQAALTMRNFSDVALESYVAAMGERMFATVGGYEIEGLGLTLMEKIEGDFSTILGLPLLPLLARLRELGLMLA
ncbi:MAG: septum formation protein Maf [Hyphomicrobiales bacterium]|nr:septum formation protein Maf [Hyphomicrobiales bacterium]